MLPGTKLLKPGSIRSASFSSSRASEVTVPALEARTRPNWRCAVAISGVSPMASRSSCSASAHCSFFDKAVPRLKRAEDSTGRAAMAAELLDGLVDAAEINKGIAPVIAGFGEVRPGTYSGFELRQSAGLVFLLPEHAT